MTRYWIIYDLGLRGNYDSLYEWLDEMKAKECGDNIATIKTDLTREQVTEKLKRIIVGPKERIYLIDRSSGGKFIHGRRKAAPWSGYARADEEDDE